MRGKASVDPASLRVLQVIPALAQGGAEVMASLLARELQGRVARVAVAGKTGLPSSEGGPAVEQPLREAGITIHHIVRPQQTVRHLALSVLQLAIVLLRERPDVIHAHNPAAGTAAQFARTLAARRRTAIVTTYHGVRPERLGAAVWALKASSDIVVGVGPSSTKALREAGVPANQSATVYNAVALPRARARDTVRAELDIPFDAELVLNVGRYRPEKNQLLLLEALALLAPARPRLHALIIGGGPMQDELEQRVVELGLTDRVRVMGGRTDVHDLLAACDVFAMSSDWEALPLVLIEAMLARAAVATTNAGGVRDIATDDVTALVVPIRDPRRLATAIGRLLDDPELRLRLTDAAAAFVESTCSVDAMIAGYCAIYSEAVGRRRARSNSLRAGASPSK